MKRLHIHMGVENLDESIRFYTALFGAEPVKTKIDYAKWMLDDPRVNFAISTRSGKKGVDHLGIQVDAASELETIRAQMSAANISTHGDGETTCCYAKSEKSWVTDPSGIAWEAYHTMEDVQMFSDSMQEAQSACCAPKQSLTPNSCGTTKKTTSCCG